MATHTVVDWTELVAAVAAASSGDTIVLNAATFTPAAAHLVVSKSLIFKNGDAYPTVTFACGAGYCVVFFGAGGAAIYVRIDGAWVVDGEGALSTYGFYVDSELGPVYVDASNITVKDTTTTGGGFTCTNTGAASTFIYDVALRNCRAENVGSGGNSADGFQTHAVNSGNVAGVLRLYNCSGIGADDEIISPHEGTTIEVYGGDFTGRITSADATTTLYIEGAKIVGAATETTRLLGLAGSVTLVNCRVTQLASQPILVASGTIVFRDCSFLYSSSSASDHLLYGSAAVDLSILRCEIDLRACTIGVTSKRGIFTEAGSAIVVEGCCLFAPKVGAGLTCQTVDLAAANSTFSHNTVVGFKGESAGDTYGVRVRDSGATVRGNIFAGLKYPIDDYSNGYDNSATSGYNLFYSGAISSLNCTFDVKNGSMKGTDVTGDPGFDWIGAGDITPKSLQIDSANGDAGELDPNDSYQMVPTELNVIGVLGGIIAVKNNSSAKVRGNICRPLDLGCWLSREYIGLFIPLQVRCAWPNNRLLAVCPAGALPQPAPVT